MASKEYLSNRRIEFIRDIKASVSALEESGAPLGDVKMVRGALDELIRGFAVFAPYRAVRKVSVFGSARTQPGDPVFQLAENFSRAIADAGFMVITGAGPGIMEAGQQGAGRARSFGVNIQLPHEQGANPVIHGDPKLLTFRYFFTRKIFFLKEADAVVLFPGGFGTHDEGYETLTLLQTGKTRPIPLILLDRPGGTFWKTWKQYIVEHLLRGGMIEREDLRLFLVTTSIDRAVHEILQYYRNFHSIRYVGDRLVIRLNRPVPEGALPELTRDFGSLLRGGAIEPCRALPAERDEPDLLALPRLVLNFDRRHYGKLRMLIDAINAVEAP